MVTASPTTRLGVRRKSNGDTMTTKRFDYVEYDGASRSADRVMKDAAYDLMDVIELIEASRERSLAITKLEEAIMWAGKAIRGQQLNRT